MGGRCPAGPARASVSWRTRLPAPRWAKTAQLESGEPPMSNPVYQKIEVTGTSTTSVEDAIQNAVARAGKIAARLRWFEVVETRGRIDNNQVAEWQVTVRIGCALDD